MTNLLLSHAKRTHSKDLHTLQSVIKADGGSYGQYSFEGGGGFDIAPKEYDYSSLGVSEEDLLRWQQLDTLEKCNAVMAEQQRNAK